MAVPKRKTSKARRDKRRASSYRLNKATVVECPQCHEPKQPHRVCRSCGYYKNREVIAVE
ncbi:50S ribosomal protein L32 [Tissierella carlieri]|jgi:large subunit ribosomal protein L32|uniref:Large ribosomal subunit protein bL32 n=3 Tax=Tissierella TaxID=41273 RepID=A0A1M4SP34_9FIRM|nr:MULTISPECIES: 50S ribosomal protein L32 [Tissierella]MDU5079848.1 50S ribosomal protein L32 [Bacillota bacterium]HAE92311.1 50S ribosomal protein L32 [Tissierella sp.]MBU5254720.1 50S ribosomal protein L32 [Tissierella praeacuta]MBU5314196.1 50S ribosomal protein L32 [Tissierella carlieri]MBU5426500.1 50S ribosomal protein L32 [Tissierella pigra]